MTILYDPQSLQLSFILCWKGTIFPLVIADPMFWLLIAVHAAILRWEHNLLAAGEEGLPELPWNASTTALSLLTFFVVFYGNNCYARYYSMHSDCVAISRTVMMWAHLTRAHFPHKALATRWNMMRCFLGGMHIQFAYLRREADENGNEVFGVSKSQWRAMRRSNLFTKAETEKLEAYDGVQSFLASSWALAEVKAALLRDRPDGGAGEGIHPDLPQLTSMPQLAIFNAFEAVARDFGAHCSSAVELLQAPVPFPYFHVLKLLLLVGMLILSYALVEAVEGSYFLSLTVYLVALFIFLGLCQIAIQMSDPFGDDDVDFDLEAFLRSAYDNSVALLNDERVPCEEVTPNDLDNPLANPELRHWDSYGVAVDDFGDSPRGDVARFRRTFEKRATKNRRSTKQQYLASRGLADVTRPTTMVYYDSKGNMIPTDSLGYPLKPSDVPGTIKGTAGYDTPYATGYGARPLSPPTSSRLPSARPLPPPGHKAVEARAFHAEQKGTPVRVVLPRLPAGYSQSLSYQA